MKIIYVCSKYKGKTEENIRDAKKFAQYISKQGFVPICVHLFLNEAMGMSEENGDREKLLEAGRLIVMKCDEVWVYSPNGELSEGMIGEIKTALANKIPIKQFNKIE